MIRIREYRARDSRKVGELIAETFGRINLDYASPEERADLLGPFRFARSDTHTHAEEIARVLQAEIALVAVDQRDIVGILRGRPNKLQSLFVQIDRLRQGIGRRLVERFEEECIAQGAGHVRVMSSLYAVPFYQAMGYKKTTGVRKMHSFEGEGLQYQPMKKVFTVEG